MPPMMIGGVFAGALLVTTLSVQAAPGNFDIAECEQQVNQVLRTDIDCTLTFGPDAENILSSTTNGVLKNYSCMVPLKFSKADVYNRWVKPESIQLPNLPLSCSISVEQSQDLRAATQIQPRCQRQDGNWLCEINMNSTRGMGVLGKVLEEQVNNSARLKTKLSEALMTLEREGLRAL